LAIVHQAPEAGGETSQLKVLQERSSTHSCTLSLEGIGGATYTLLLRENAHALHVQAHGATLGNIDHGLRVITVTFPAAPAYITREVNFSW